MIKAIFFDLDETLLDRNGSILQFLAQQHAHFFNELTNVPVARYQNRFLHYDEHGYAPKEMAYARLVDEFALPIAAEHLIADFYANCWRSPLLFPNAVTLLQKLRTDGYRLGIITNGSVRSQRSKLEHGKLLSLVDVALISEEEGVRKPDALIFQRAARHLDLAPTECVMVGDNPLADIGGALAVDMKAIWRRGYLPWPDAMTRQPSHVINTIGELVEIDWQDL